MGVTKGCVNEKCIAHKEKITYKESDDYCSKCGEKLFLVCKKCYKVLENSSEKYCVRCLADKEDREDKAKKVVGSIGGALLTVGGIIISKGKDIPRNIKKLK